jgi:hypothetical protein
MRSTADQIAEVAALALRVGKERQKKMAEMKAAFEAGDEGKALAIARALCGAQAQEKEAA